VTRAPSEGWWRAAPDGARRGYDTLQRVAGQKIAADSRIEDASLWVPSNVVNDFIFQMDAVVGHQAIAMMKSIAIKHSSQSCSGSAFNSWREVQGMKTGLDDILAGARGRFQAPALQPLFDILAKLMLQRDEPDYQRIRSLIQKAFLRTPVERSLAGRIVLAKYLFFNRYC
jgi:hypothetical protein